MGMSEFVFQVFLCDCGFSSAMGKKDPWKLFADEVFLDFDFMSGNGGFSMRLIFVVASRLKLSKVG